MRRARVAVWIYFFISGMIMAAWAARVPAVKAQAGLNDGQLSIALLGLALGALAAMQVAGRMVDRFGSAANVLPAAFFGSLALIAPGYANSLPFLFVALFAVGFGHGMIDVPINVHAARIQRSYGRPIMASFHAAFPIGGFVGAGIGGLAAYVELSAAATFWIVSVALALLSLVVRRGLLPGRDAAAESDAERPPERRRRLLPDVPPRVVLLGAVAFCCMLAEGSATDWATVFLHDSRGASGALAAAGFSVFSGMMACGRLVGDRLAARFGAVRIVRVGAVTAAVGLGAGLVVPSAAVGVIGFGLMGAGLSCVIPQVFTAATSHDPRRAGRNLGFTAAMGYTGLLSGPVTIGAVAHSSSLAVALAIPLLLALLIALAAGRLRAADTVRRADLAVT
ncbi:MFS transporter [Marinitenerispora sediminis]|uniref:MFS transporter n=2 Tax=Marinitenerispora sediminis TaxID=1931232 RepID=A0A368T631_9ACTN|nr:MFS transporter [Marinitenerispora sediminis]RCV55524.1 MFS transporter [Marinitenerispora sediminis]RCV57828.1 MFS transporter [Marinitenerispora sediminis]